MAALPGTPLALRGTKTTIGELALWWLHNVEKHQVRPSSWAQIGCRVDRIVSTLGGARAASLQLDHVVVWQGELLQRLAPKTVRDTTQTLAQIVDHGIELGIVGRNVVRQVKRPKAPPSNARSLTVAEMQALVHAAADDRYGAVVALLFLQGWRVSEALGLAWDDLDLDAGLARVRRACVYVGGQGAQLGPPKSGGVLGDHQLAPTVVSLLRRRQLDQANEQATTETWPAHEYGGRPVRLVFTTPTGGLVLRQRISKSITKAATAAGLSTEHLATHTGRRSVITALYAEAGESIDEIAHFVGHASPATTAGYVRDLGTRPAAFARRAAQLLDPSADSS
jgi:integrase